MLPSINKFTAAAESVYPHLKGVFCIYKPPEVSSSYIKFKLKSCLSRDLNQLKTRQPINYIDVNQTSAGVSINVRPSYADNVLSVGPRYQEEDIEIFMTDPLSKVMSGVQIVGINEGKKLSDAIKYSHFTKCFHVKGILGQATTDYFSDSKVLARAKYDKVTKFFLDKILTSYQGVNTRKMFQEYGFYLDTQEAYEFAVNGMYRPGNKGAPIIYSMKTVEFEPPNFTIEVQSIYTTENDLKALIHNIGVSLKCFASCSGIRCIREGCLHVEHALLQKHWTLENILENMKLCHKVLKEHFPQGITYTPTVTGPEESSSEN